MSDNDFLTVFNKNNPRKIVMLTAYDYPSAVLVARAGVDVILVGDSLANVVLGLEATTQIGMPEMLHHTQAVCRGAGQVPVVADIPASVMPAETDTACTRCVDGAKAFIAAGCVAVKIEWSMHGLAAVRAVRQAGIEVMAHVGLTPQTAVDFKVQGRDAASAAAIVEQARAMEAAGCFAVVLECVPEGLAREITGALNVPTIGIGAGKFCDGQVLVLHDMIGLNDRKVPRFVKKYADVSGVIVNAIQSYTQEVRQGLFPEDSHTFH